ncbi:hypothetical protein ACFL2Y_02935 [Candidatus Omnitrophota bacterium]
MDSIRIGIDFDNTIIDYREIFIKTVENFGWMKFDKVESKQQIRDLIKALPEGDVKWMKLQALVYGELISQAPPTKGVIEFIKRCRHDSIPLFIISHKTEYVDLDGCRKNLRKAAFSWLKKHRFFDSNGLGFDKADVFFEDSRIDKIKRISKVGCTHFIDDLDDVLQDPEFPDGVMRILYDDKNSCFKEGFLSFIVQSKEDKERICKYG